MNKNINLNSIVKFHPTIDIALACYVLFMALRGANIYRMRIVGDTLKIALDLNKVESVQSYINVSLKKENIEISEIDRDFNVIPINGKRKHVFSYNEFDAKIAKAVMELYNQRIKSH